MIKNPLPQSVDKTRAKRWLASTSWYKAISYTANICMRDTQHDREKDGEDTTCWMVSLVFVFVASLVTAVIFTPIIVGALSLDSPWWAFIAVVLLAPTVGMWFVFKFKHTSFIKGLTIFLSSLDEVWEEEPKEKNWQLHATKLSVHQWEILARDKSLTVKNFDDKKRKAYNSVGEYDPDNRAEACWLCTKSQQHIKDTPNPKPNLKIGAKCGICPIVTHELYNINGVNYAPCVEGDDSSYIQIVELAYGDTPVADDAVQDRLLRDYTKGFLEELRELQATLMLEEEGI